MEMILLKSIKLGRNGAYKVFPEGWSLFLNPKTIDTMLLKFNHDEQYTVPKELLATPQMYEVFKNAKLKVLMDELDSCF